MGSSQKLHAPAVHDRPDGLPSGSEPGDRGFGVEVDGVRQGGVLMPRFLTTNSHESLKLCKPLDCVTLTIASITSMLST